MIFLILTAFLSIGLSTTELVTYKGLKSRYHSVVFDSERPKFITAKNIY